MNSHNNNNSNRIFYSPSDKERLTIFFRRQNNVLSLEFHFVVVDGERREREREKKCLELCYLLKNELQIERIP